MKKVELIMGVIKGLIVNRFTGILRLTIYFNEGGIRDVIKNIESRISDS